MREKGIERVERDRRRERGGGEGRGSRTLQACARKRSYGSGEGAVLAKFKQKLPHRRQRV